MNDLHTCARHVICVCECFLPVAWQESSVCIIVVTAVSDKNSASISVQSILGNMSVRLLWQIPVQLYHGGAYRQMSGL